MSQARFQKSMRERNRREKAEAKRQRKVERAEQAASQDETPEPDSADGQQRVLAELAALHERFEAGNLDFEDFEVRKRELLTKLDV